MRRMIAVFALLAPALAQTVDRTKAPDTPPIPVINYRPFERTTLPNGTK